jgi:hypothetical protein
MNTIFLKGRSVIPAEGAEMVATALSQGLAYEHPHRSVHNYVVQWGMSEASLQARLRQAYIQGRADEAATREAAK